jgi:hypothetical protein
MFLIFAKIPALNPNFFLNLTLPAEALREHLPAFDCPLHLKMLYVQPSKPFEQ